MKHRKVWFFSSLSVFTVVIVLLVTGSPLLIINLGKQDAIPLGTFLTWLGMVSLPLAIYLGSRSFRSPQTKLYRVLSSALKFLILAAIGWVPISYLLAGNLSFTFSEKAPFQGGQLAMKWFWVLSYGIPITALVLLLVHWIVGLFSRNYT